MNHRTRIDPRSRRNWLVDAAVLLGGLLAGLSGVYFLFLPSGGFQGGRNAMYGVTVLFERHTWSDLHLWGGVLMIAAAVLHLILHWDWVATMARRIWRTLRVGDVTLSRGSRLNVVLNAVVAISFLVVAISGVYFLFAPAGGFQGGRNPGWDPMFLFSRTTWDVLHTWAGVILIGSATLHFAIHWRWVTAVTRRLIRSLQPEAGARPVPEVVRVPASQR